MSSAVIARLQVLLCNGLAQLRAAGDPGTAEHARRLGTGTAVTLAAADLIYVGNGTLSKMYLLDAAVELRWISLWRRQRRTELP